MKILFVHDHKFKKRYEQYYSNGSFPAVNWSRYLSDNNTLTVVGRDGGLLENNQKGYTLSSADEVSFKLLPSISNFKSLLFGNSTVNMATQSLVAKHDAVIVRLPSRLGHLFVKEALKQDKPYAVEVVGCIWDALWNYGNWKGKIFAPFAIYSQKKIVANSPFVLYVTEIFLQNRYPCLNGITEFCSNVEIPSVNDEILEQRLNKINSSDNILTFGMIANYASKYKGIDVAIRALALNNSELLDWKFEIIGSGDPYPYQKLARNLGIGDKVHFVGNLPSGKPVYDWLDTVDIYLHPSFQEGLPRSLIEAMSRGCPALATKIGGIPELLNASEMVKAGDYFKLANEIKGLVQNKKRLLGLAKQNFHKAQKYYKPILDKRRSEFWNAFFDYVIINQK